MKTHENKPMLLLFTFLICGFGAFAQGDSIKELPYTVDRVYSSLSITKNQLTNAVNLTDLNQHYKRSWVDEYESVEVSVMNNGTLKTISNKSYQLSQEQKELMNTADTNSDIVVKTRYYPDNNLTHNDVKVFDFTFSVEPEKEAIFVGGQEQLLEYLEVTAIEKIPQEHFQGYDVAAVNFTINKRGQVADAKVFDTSMYSIPQDKEVDALLLEAICEMPDWIPATYADGTRVEQQFVFLVGNMKNCIIPLLNTRRKLD